MRKIFHSFNMVEIVLAIGVVAFGITGVMALLPPALNANRDTVNDVFVDEAISKMRLLFKTFFEPNFNSYVKNGNYMKSGSFSESDVNNFPATYSPATMETKKLFSNTDLHNLFRIFRDGNVYYLNSDNGETASAVHVLLYKQDLPIENVGLGASTLTYSSGKLEGYRISMIFSWPVTAAWSARQKRIVIYDCFPNQP